MPTDARSSLTTVARAIALMLGLAPGGCLYPTGDLVDRDKQRAIGEAVDEPDGPRATAVLAKTGYGATPYGCGGVSAIGYNTVPQGIYFSAPYPDGAPFVPRGPGKDPGRAGGYGYGAGYGPAPPTAAYGYGPGAGFDGPPLGPGLGYAPTPIADFAGFGGPSILNYVHPIATPVVGSVPPGAGDGYGGPPGAGYGPAGAGYGPAGAGYGPAGAGYGYGASPVEGDGYGYDGPPVEGDGYGIAATPVGAVDAAAPPAAPDGPVAVPTDIGYGPYGSGPPLIGYPRFGCSGNIGYGSGTW